ncbi:hypothetical protein Tco_0853988 [Tanacetum coccineum]
MTKSYCLMQLSYVRLNIPSTNKSFQAPHDPSLQQQPFMENLINRLEHSVIKLVKLISSHQSLSFALVQIHNPFGSYVVVYGSLYEIPSNVVYGLWNYQINNVIAREVEELVLNMK